MTTLLAVLVLVETIAFLAVGIQSRITRRQRVESRRLEALRGITTERGGFRHG